MDQSIEGDEAAVAAPNAADTAAGSDEASGSRASTAAPAIQVLTEGEGKLVDEGAKDGGVSDNNGYGEGSGGSSAAGVEGEGNKVDGEKASADIDAVSHNGTSVDESGSTGDRNEGDDNIAPVATDSDEANMQAASAEAEGGEHPSGTELKPPALTISMEEGDPSRISTPFTKKHDRDDLSPAQYEGTGETPIGIIRESFVASAAPTPVYKYLHVRVYVCMYVCVYVCVCLCLYVCVCECSIFFSFHFLFFCLRSLRLNNICMYIYVYIYIYICVCV